jgi:hypothetical protein
MIAALTGAAGRVLGAIFYAVGRLRRRGKALHPRGQVMGASLRRFGVQPPTGVAWLDDPGEGDVLISLSRAIGLPRGWPDILGLALRAPIGEDRYGDLLFATTGTGTLARFVLRPTVAEPGQTRYTTYLPYRAPSGPVLFGAFPVAARPGVLALRCAGPFGPWRQFAELELKTNLEPTGDEAEPLISFDPMLNALPGLQVYRWHRNLREYAYAAARRARSVTAPSVE